MSVTTEMISDAVVDPGEHQDRKSIVKPYVMSHGTLECRSMKETRKFYEGCPGLAGVAHAIPAMIIPCGLKFPGVWVEGGDKIKPVSLLNHWGIDVESK